MPYAPSVFLPCLTLRVFRCLLPLHPKQIFSLVNNNTCSVIIYVPPDYHNFLFFMPSGYSYPLPQTDYESRSTDNPAVPCFCPPHRCASGVPSATGLFYHCSFILVNFGHYALMQKRPEIMFQIRPYLDLIIVSFRAINPDDVWQVKQIMRLRPITSGVCCLSFS